MILKKRLKGIFLVGAIGLTAFSGQHVLAADNQADLTSTSSLTTSSTSSAQVSDSTDIISSSSISKETENKTSEVERTSQSNQILKSNAQIGPGFYTVSAPSRMLLCQ